MNNNQVNITQPGSTPPPFKDRAVLIAKNIFNKFYSNKRIFWPVTIAFSLIILVTIIGLIFGTKSRSSQLVRVTPTPTPQNGQEAPTSGNIVTDSQNKLNSLKSQIDGLDVKESRLQPPTINFNVKF